MDGDNILENILQTYVKGKKRKLKGEVGEKTEIAGK